MRPSIPSLLFILSILKGVHMYTPDEIHEMPPGRDLDAAIAVTFFGWRWMQYQAPNRATPWLLTGLFPPEAPNRICVANQYDLIWQPSDRHQERFTLWDHSTWWDDGQPRLGFPDYSTNMGDAWLVVTHLRDLWTAATENVPGWQDSFNRPFDDAAFFERLQRHADRRWPWAMLYMTPAAICKAALLAQNSPDPYITKSPDGRFVIIKPDRANPSAL